MGRSYASFDGLPPVVHTQADGALVQVWTQERSH